MKRLALLIPFLFGVMGCQRTHCQSQPTESIKTQLWIFGGQSNMTGFLPYGIQISNDPRIIYLNDPLNGPAVSFLHAYIGMHPKQTIASLQFAIGGTSIVEWEPGQPGPFGPPLFDAMISTIKQALAQNPNLELAGFIFSQGECDSSPLCKPFPTAEWKNAFTFIIRSLRSNLNAPNLPVIFAQLGTTSDLSNSFWEDIKAQQTLVQIPNVSMIKTDDLARRDAVHLTDESFEIVGQRFETQFEQMTNSSCSDSDGLWIHF